MIHPEPSRRVPLPAIQRLAALADLDADALALLERAAERRTHVPARRELLTEGMRVAYPLLMLEGWAARVRIVPDGRRQIIGFVLPGDIVGNYGYDGAVAASTVIAMTEAATCVLPQGGGPRLERAYAVCRALEEAYLMAQIVRLGRLDAAERITDLMLELHERLALAGLSIAGRFDFPLTQEVFADALGLTSVHVNRMVQQARKRGELVWGGRSVSLTDPERSRRLLGRERTKVF